MAPSISTQQLSQYLETTHGYQIIGIMDLDWLNGQSRNTLYKAFKQWHRLVFESNEKIILYSRTTITNEMLQHIQTCGSSIDIPNYFILVCSPTIDQYELDVVRQQYSIDNNSITSLQIQFLDQTIPETTNAALILPRTFCFSPWAHLEISSRGEFKPCCVFKESIKDSNGRSYNIKLDTVEQVYNSDYLTNLRNQFLNGDSPAGCSTCWHKEQHHGTSNRLWLSDHLGVNAHFLNIEKESIDNLISLDIKLGNLCNFKCRICTPGSSSRIAEEQVKHFNSNIHLKDLNARGQWVDNEYIWKMFEVLGKQLINIDFYGGEPFLIKQQLIFLDYLIENDYAKNIRLHYNSNGSVYPMQLFEKWKQFRAVDVAFSIDNIGSRFELERGGTWDQVENNLDKFIKYKLPNMELSIFNTINVQNVYYIDEFLHWFEEKKFNVLTFNLLESPNFLSITTMSPELTDTVLKQLYQIPHDKLTKYNILPIITLLEQNMHTENLIDQLADYMLKLDLVRNQKFNHSHHEITDIIYKGKNYEKAL